MYQIDEIVRFAKYLTASDIHIVCGLPIRVRIDGDLRDMSDTVMTPELCEEYARVLAGSQFEKIAQMGEIDTAGTYAGIRVRINVFRQQNTFSAAIRILNNVIPTPAELKMPPVMQELVKWKSGLILITGETGAGKSTTVASLLDQINHNRYSHIITLEDPIEYVFTPDRCMITQRQIGVDSESFSSALRSVLREDPDVIFIGEMRDRDTVEAAVVAAETGHLVISTLHTNSAADTVDRILAVFPDSYQRRIRVQLAAELRAVVSQQLLQKKAGAGRVAAFEVMVVNKAIQNLIREGKTAQIDSFIGLSTQDGSISMMTALQKLAREGDISRELAKDRALIAETYENG